MSCYPWALDQRRFNKLMGYTYGLAVFLTVNYLDPSEEIPTLGDWFQANVESDRNPIIYLPNIRTFHEHEWDHMISQPQTGKLARIVAWTRMSKVSEEPTQIRLITAWVRIRDNPLNIKITKSKIHTKLTHLKGGQKAAKIEYIRIESSIIKTHANN